jgi:hypothetical protein
MVYSVIKGMLLNEMLPEGVILKNNTSAGRSFYEVGLTMAATIVELVIQVLMIGLSIILVGKCSSNKCSHGNGFSVYWKEHWWMGTAEYL